MRFISINLYENRKTGNSFLSTTTENDQNLKFIYSFYVVDPNIQTIPNGANFLCVTQENQSITEISQIRDPFNTDEKCLRFIVWTQPISLTIPLYLYKNSSGIEITLLPKEKGNYSQDSSDRSVLSSNELYYSPMFVFPSTTQFRFDNGFCIPSKTGMSLDDCNNSYNKNNVQPSLLGRLTTINTRYEKRTKYVVFFSILLFAIVFFTLYFFRKALWG